MFVNYSYNNRNHSWVMFVKQTKIILRHYFRTSSQVDYKKENGCE